MSDVDVGRRRFITAAIGTGLVLAGCTGRERTASTESERKSGEEEISPAEDLMREHGVLERILLVYEESARRINAGENLPADVLKDASGIIRSFIKNYHERLEEEHIFPKFKEQGTSIDLVDTLQRQHDAGRRITDRIRRAVSNGIPQSEQERRNLTSSISAFIRMYRPHAAREDTVLFPAFRELMPAEDYEKLGETFEDREHELFGEEGFTGIVGDVADLERKLGIYDLNKFTPR